MSEGINITCVEDTHCDNSFDWASGVLRLGELDVVSVKDMVAKVIAECNGRLIRRLCIIGHGSPGCQSVGCGMRWDWTGRRALLVDKTNRQLVGEAATELARLAGKFAPEAIVTLGGCEVARGSYGKALLRGVSRALGGVIVQASEAMQTPVWALKGTVIRCKDDTCWVAQTGREAVGLLK